MRRQFIIFIALIIALFVGLALLLGPIYWYAFGIIIPILLLGLYDMFISKSPIIRNFPIMGHGRNAALWFRPKVYQYFVEPDHEGRPITRNYREIVHRRAKDKSGTTPFGTQKDVYEEGYEWMNHSINPINPEKLDKHPRVLIGGKDCKQPYSASLLNISAMSFGSLSKNAVMAMNGGAALGNFAQNTGEGGISQYHNHYNGDLIYQLGTGYFGSRNKEGGFDPDLFKKRASADNVKMIEIKLSQGAKPGHGGILPAKKATPEIAEIRNIEPYKAVHSPPYHKEFDSPKGLLNFVKKLRELSGGKPVGFKLCIGHKAEFLSICKAIIDTQIYPDFIAIDGGEGGTGAAPIEFSNSVGMPFKDGLSFAYNALEGFGIKEEIRLIASGKVTTAFHIFRAMALGADTCYSARAMMLSVGCIQALECHSNTCPTGVATQKKHLMKGLVYEEKRHHVANFHKNTMECFVELMAASGLDDPDKINRSHIYRRILSNENLRYDDIYPYIPSGSLLNENTIPASWKKDMALSSSETFILSQPLEKFHL